MTIQRQGVISTLKDRKKLFSIKGHTNLERTGGGIKWDIKWVPLINTIRTRCDHFIPLQRLIIKTPGAKTFIL